MILQNTDNWEPYLRLLQSLPLYTGASVSAQGPTHSEMMKDFNGDSVRVYNNILSSTGSNAIGMTHGGSQTSNIGYYTYYTAKRMGITINSFQPNINNTNTGLGFNTTYSFIKLVFGEDGTAFSSSDYSMDFIPMATNTSSGIPYIQNTLDAYALTSNIKISNYSNNDYTIREVGIIATLPMNGVAAATANKDNFLLKRGVLTNPIDLSAGKFATFSIRELMI